MMQTKICAMMFSLIIYPTTCLALSKQSHTLAAVNHPNGYDAPEGSIAILKRKKNICTISITLYGETGKIIYLWHFNASGLKQAQRTEYNYTDGGLAMLPENQGQFLEYVHSNQKLNTHAQEVQSEFKKVRGFFPNQLVSCI